jgi:hypothetical protein
MAIVNAPSTAGADAIKFQTFTPEQMVDADKVVEGGPWAGRKAIELYREAHVPREWHSAALRIRAQHGHLVPFSSVFHPDDVDFLETPGLPDLQDRQLRAHRPRPDPLRAAVQGQADDHQHRHGTVEEICTRKAA